MPEPVSDLLVTDLIVTDLTVIALQGIPEVTAGDDLARLLLDSAAHSGPVLGAGLRTGDIVVVSSKVVSKALGLTAPADQRDKTVAAQTVRVVAERRTPRGLAQVVESAAGPVMAAAGVDASNAAPGVVLLLPADGDGAARRLRASLVSQGAPLVGVVITDTAGRAWRTGQTDFALGCAGLQPIDDLRGMPDASGALLEVTERAVADQIAAAADLVKGKASGVPAAVVRGLSSLVTEDDGPGAAALLREPSSDWFRYGHVEAVRAALGVPTGVEVPGVGPERLQHRVQRALDVALHSWVDGSGVVQPGEQSCDITLTADDEFDCGVLTARLLAALWAEDLQGRVRRDGLSAVVTAYW